MHKCLPQYMLLCLFVGSSEQVQHNDKYFTTLLSVIEKFPELKIKTIELLANLARKGMCNQEFIILWTLGVTNKVHVEEFFCMC